MRMVRLEACVFKLIIFHSKTGLNEKRSRNFKSVPYPDTLLAIFLPNPYQKKAAADIEIGCIVSFFIHLIHQDSIVCLNGPKASRRRPEVRHQFRARYFKIESEREIKVVCASIIVCINK